MKPVEGTFSSMTSIVLYNWSSNVHNHVLDCHCTKMMYSGIFDLHKENTFTLLNLTLTPFYLCLLGAGAEGVEGFFKGIGKGLLGLLVHPTGGVVDMVSFTLDGVRRLTFLNFNLVSHKFVIY